MIKAMFLILISIAASGCGSSSALSQSALESLIKSKIGSSYTILYNTSKEYALCQQTSTGDHANRKYKYIVVKVAENTITNEGSFQNGYAKWSDNLSIEVSSAGLNEKVEKRIISVNAQKS